MKSNIMILLLVLAFLLCGCHKRNSQPIPASESTAAAATVSEEKDIYQQETTKPEVVEESVPVTEKEIVDAADTPVLEQVQTIPVTETQKPEMPEVIETEPKTEPVIETENVQDAMPVQFDSSRLNGRWEYRLHRDGTNYISYIIFGDNQTISTGIGIEYGEIYNAFDGSYSIVESISETDAIINVKVSGGYIELGEAPPSNYAEAEVYIHLGNGTLSTYMVSGDSFHFYNDSTEYTLEKVS